MQYIPFQQRYETLAQIATGTHSKIFKVREKSTNAILACKEVDYRNLPPDKSTALCRSIEDTSLMIKSMTHKNIIQYNEVLHDRSSRVYRIIMPHYEFQDLQSYAETIRAEGKVILEQNLWVILGQLASALEYLHSDSGSEKKEFGTIVHFNVNLSNILLTKDFNVVLTGFTNSVILAELGPNCTPAGKLSYCSPELLQNNSCGTEVDIWALACSIYELATSSSLFLGITPTAILRAITQCDIASLTLPNYSLELLHTLKSMLVFDPRARISAAQLVTHPKVSFYLTHDLHLQEIAGKNPDTLFASVAPQSSYAQHSSPTEYNNYTEQLGKKVIPVVPSFVINKSEFMANPQPDSLLLGDQTTAEQSYLNYTPAKASSRIRSTSVGGKRCDNDMMSVSIEPGPGDSIIAMMNGGRRASSKGIPHIPESSLIGSTIGESAIMHDDAIRAGSVISKRSNAPRAHRYETFLDKSIEMPFTTSQTTNARVRIFQQSNIEPNTVISEVPSPDIIKEKPEVRRLSPSLEPDEQLHIPHSSKQLLQTRYNPEGELMSVFADDPTELIASHISPQPIRIRIAKTGGTEMIETTNSAGETVPRYQVPDSIRSSTKALSTDGSAPPNAAANSCTRQSTYYTKASPAISPQLPLLANNQQNTFQEHQMMRCYPIEYVNNVNQHTNSGHTDPALFGQTNKLPLQLPQGDGIYGLSSTGPAQYYTVPLNTGIQGKGQLYVPNDLQIFKQSELNFSTNETNAGVTETIHFIDAQSYTSEIPPYTELMKAVIKNDLKSVRTAIPSDAGRTIPGGITALMIAANMGHVECVKMLVAKEGGMRQKDGTTALMEAVQKKHAEVIKHLLKREAGMRRTDGWTSLMYCAQHDLTNIAKQLVAKEIGLQTVSGVTALMVACEHGHLDMAAMLLKEAGKHAVNGWTALMSACEHNYTDMALKLASREAGMVKVDGWTALMSAARNGNIKIAKALVKKEAKCTKNDGSSALMWAASNGNVELVKLLMKDERHIQTVTGKTAFDFAEETSNYEVMKLLRPDLFDKSGNYIKGTSSAVNTVRTKSAKGNKQKKSKK